MMGKLRAYPNAVKPFIRIFELRLPIADPITFSQRLKLLLGLRKMTPWATELRIPSGTMTRMFQGQGIPPTYETLVRIMRTENVSLSWLLGGDCAPFLVARTVDDDETAELVKAHMEDGFGGEFVVLGGGGLGAILMYDEAEIDHPNGTISYLAVDLIAGPIGSRAAMMLRQAAPAGGPSTRNVGTAAMRDLYAGRLGTYDLLGDDNGDALIFPYKVYREDISPLDLDRKGRIAEIQTEYAATTVQRFAEAWPRMQEAEQDVMTRLLEPFIRDVSQRGGDPID